MPDPDAPTPRLRLPLRVGPTGALETVEQHSDADINQCLRALARTRIGDRPDMPTLGVPNLTHSEQPVDLDALSDTLARHEPRATLDIVQEAVDQMTADVDIDWDREPDPDPDPESEE